MDLHHLRTLRKVAEQGSLSAAARSLGVAQPRLSELLRALEEEVGTPLFLRTRDGVVPTEAGLLLLDRAEAVLAMVDTTLEELRQLGEGERGHFVIGCHDSLGSYFLPDFLGPFLATYRAIQLTLFNGASAAVRDAVLARKVHYGLVVNTEPHPDLVILPCFHDAIRVLHASPCEDVEEARARLRAGPLIYPQRPPFEDYTRRLAALGLLSDRLIPCGDLGLVRSLGRSGLGPVVLPTRVAQDTGAALHPLHPTLPVLEDVIHLVWRADLPRTRSAARVRQALLAHGHVLDERGTNRS
jgi:DNA-binding transcriptional LysR family regulator